MGGFKMGITFGGISSGLPVNQIIDSIIAAERIPLLSLEQKIQRTQQKKTAVDQVRTRVNSFKTSLNQFTSKSVLDENLFNAKIATSSDDASVGVTATEKGAAQSFSLKVNKLATSTSATSLDYVGAAAAGATRLSDIKNVSFSSGNFTVFTNGTANTINVDTANDTIDDVLGRLTALNGISGASIDAEGKISLTADTPGTVQMGSASDSTNFLRLTKLNTAQEDLITGVRTAQLPLSTVDSTANVSTAGAGFKTAVTAGSTFKINGASFDTTGKSLENMVKEINDNAASGVSATYNSTTNRLQLNAKETGQIGIQLEDTTGNFLNAVGLMSGTNSLASQTLGLNAEVELNGNLLYSVGNKLTEDVSGLTGVTLDLKNTTAGNVAINVGRDTKRLSNALKDIVDQYNNVVNIIDQETKAVTGRLGANNSIRGFRNNIRQLMSSSVNGATTYNSLSLVGIGTANSGGLSATATMSFDSTKFFDALAKNPADIEALFTGADGIFTRMQTLVDQSVKTSGVNSEAGLFQSINNSFDSSIKRYNENISRGEDRLARRRTQLQRQYAASDSLIAQYQSQGQAITGLSNQLSNNNRR